FIYLLDNIASIISVSAISTALSSVSFLNHYENFTVGVLNVADLIFFLSIIALFVFLTVRVIEKKRWS
nr:ABC transporter [Lachnospiraceae bacterium]